MTLLFIGYERYSDFEIEKKARALGMIYKDEVRALEIQKDGEDK